jgi:drug/metabolite transporter (DMT)-like permease
VSGFKDRAAVVTEASLLLAVLFLGSNFVAVKYTVGEVPPLPFVAARFTLAGLVALALVRAPWSQGASRGGGTCSPWRGWVCWAWGQTTWQSPLG